MTLSQIDTFGLHLLCIDDSKSQLAMYKDELGGMYAVTCALGYQEAVGCLTATQPDLIILDMEMPQVSGLEFLDILRSTPSYARIPVIIVSGDNNPTDVKEAFVRGASDYVRKPYDAEELMLRINRIFQLIDGARANEKESKGSLGSAQELLVRSMAELAAARDNRNTKHLERIGLYAAELTEKASSSARFRAEISPDFQKKIAALAKLHDIGMVNVPDHILVKAEALTERELTFIRKHPVDGARTIDAIRHSFPDYGFLDFATDIIIGHHEKWDGSGYPEGLAGDSIPLSARIVAIADTFDTVTTKRVYRDAVGFDEACKIVADGKGTSFDPDLVDVFRFCHVRFREILEKNRL